MIKVKDGYAKLIGTTYSGSADRVLLSNGGDKAVSDFAAASVLSDYVTLATAQTITGVKTFTSSIYINSGKSIVDEGGHGVLGIKATTWSGVPSDGTAISLGTLNNSLYFRSSSDNIYHYRSDKGVAYKVLDASNYSSYALPLNGGTMNLGEGLKFHSDSNYFGENLDARIISLLDGNGYSCDGGLIIDERATYNGTEYITELLRIRDNEFKWKGNTIWHAGNLTKVSQLTNDSGYVTGGPYLPLSGGTITGKLIVDGILQSNSGIIRPSETTPNAVSAITFYKGSKSTDFKRDAVIGWYNEGGTNSNGALYLVPYPQDIDPWSGSVGLHISQTHLLFEGNTVYHSGNLTKSSIGLSNVQNTAFYKRQATVNGTTWNLAGTTNSLSTFTIYAPETAGTSGQVLTSSGGTPNWTDQSSLIVGIARSLAYKSLPSSTTNATNTVWCKFARITYNAKAWCNANGYFIFSGGESTDHAGILSYHFRAGSTATDNSIAILEWLVKNRDTATVIAEKVEDNVYDLYINNYSSYTCPIIYHMTAQPERFTWSVGSWTTTKPTAAFTSIDSGRVNYATTSSSSTIVGDGTVTLIPQYNNEINIGGTYASNRVFIGYRATGSKPIPSSFIFGGSSGTASITASKFIKSGGTETQLLRADGGVATFNWSGQSGQPTWLWGGNDKNAYYVYNPANFNVNSATTSTILLTNNTAQAADACYDESPGLRFWRFNGTGNDIGGGDGWIMSWSWNTGSVGGQIYLDDNPSKTMAIRGRNNNVDKTFTSWSKFLHSTNYTEYTVKKDGTGASGTWGINISGTAANANTLDNIDSTGFLRKVTIANNVENDFNTFENMTLTGRGDPKTGASLVNAPWTGSGPAGGYGVLTYLWSGYGTQMAWGYHSNRIYIRPKYYSGGDATWSSTWDSLALTSDIPTTLKNPNALTVFGVTYDGSSAQTVNEQTLINRLGNGTSDCTDSTIMLTSHTNGWSGNAGIIYGRPASKLYNYINSKISSIYVPKNYNNIAYSDLIAYYTGSTSPGYYRIVLPDSVLSIWNMLTIELTVNQNYTNGYAGKILIYCHNNGSNTFPVFKATCLGTLTSDIKIYGSGGKYIYIGGCNAWGTISIDKILVGDAATGKDQSSITIDTISALPTTYQTATMSYNIDSSNIGSQSVNYATSAGTADNSNKLGGYAASNYLLKTEAKIYRWSSTIKGQTWSRLYTGSIDSVLHHSSMFSISGSIGCVVFSQTFLVVGNHSTNAKIIQLNGGSYTQCQMRALVKSDGTVLIDMYWVGNDCDNSTSTNTMTIKVNALCFAGDITPTTSFTSDATIPSGYSDACTISTRSNCMVLHEVYAYGSMYAAHFYENSDINLKKNIKAILDSDNIPVIKEFDWKSDGTHSYGLIAQELEEQGYSELVSDSGSHKTVNYSAALSLIVGKLQNKIKELEKEIENLKLRN